MVVGCASEVRLLPELPLLWRRVRTVHVHALRIGPGTVREPESGEGVRGTRIHRVGASMRLLQTVLAAAALLVAGGCGADGTSGEPDGVYALEIDDTCADVVSFDPKDDTYAWALQCLLEGSNEVGAEVEWGDYRLEFGVVRFTPRRSSCADADLGPYSMDFSVYESGDLFLSDDEAAGEFVKVPRKTVEATGPGGGVFLLGCWDGEDFYPN